MKDTNEIIKHLQFGLSKGQKFEEVLNETCEVFDVTKEEIIEILKPLNSEPSDETDAEVKRNLVELFLTRDKKY